MTMTPVSITNESQLGAEGTYLIERDPPPLVEGAKLNNVGVTGECVKGPEGVVKIEDPGRFAAVFGGRDYGSGGDIIGDVWQWLVGNTFGTLYVARAVASDATTAEKDFSDAVPTPIVNIAASSKGAWGNDIDVTILDASDGDSDHFNVLAEWNGVSQLFEDINVSDAGVDNILEVMGDDDANLIVLTKLADGRPVNAAAGGLTDTTTTDGTIADTDFTGAGATLEQLANHEKANIISVAGRMNSAVKAKLNSLGAAAGPGEVYLFDPDSETVAKATYETEVAALTVTDRCIACFNHRRIYDPTNTTKMYQQPSALMASVLSQTAADVHPGAKANVRYAAGTIELAHELSPAEYTSLRASRICAIQRVSGGYKFRSGVTLKKGTEGEITARRQKDFLILSAAERIENDVYEQNSRGLRDARRSDIMGFLSNLAESGRYIGISDGSPDAIYDTESLNTDADRALGIQRDRMSVRLMPHNLWIVLIPTISTANGEFFVAEG